MKISKEVIEIARDSRKLEDLSEMKKMDITTYHPYSGRSRAKTGVLPSGLAYVKGEASNIVRDEDTIVWDSNINCPVFTSDNFIIKCFSYSNSTGLNNIPQELPKSLIIKNAKGQ
jgi:hypothetical protein